MTEWYRAAATSEVAVDRPKGVLAQGVPIVLVRKPEGVYALFGICSHMHVFLMKGYLEDYSLECPLHEGRFDIRTGACLVPPPTEDLPIYEVKEEYGEIYIRLTADQIEKGRRNTKTKATS